MTSGQQEVRMFAVEQIVKTVGHVDLLNATYITERAKILEEYINNGK